MKDDALTLSRLTAQVKSVLADVMGGFYWVVAEIAELKVNGMSGHCYLEFIEKDAANKTIARMRGNIWAAQYRMIQPYFESITGQLLEPGIKVLIKVTVEFHEVYGMSLSVRDIDPSYTMGDLSRKRMEVLKQLEAEGVLEMNKELVFPTLPQRIAVISSSNAAGYEDFVEQLSHNPQGYLFHVQLFEAVMQGDGAALSVMNALDAIYQQMDDFDCVVIVRGGGAALDLTCFDDYDLAYLITQFPLPILSGIGHQKDDTITDMVAYHKLKTPTAVAEYLVECMSEQEMNLDALISKLLDTSEAYLKNEKNRFERIVMQLPMLTKNRVHIHTQKLAQLSGKLPFIAQEYVRQNTHVLNRISDHLHSAVPALIHNKKRDVRRLETALLSKTSLTLEKQKHRLDALAVKAAFLDPTTILKRGYSITMKEGKVIKSATVLKPGDLIETTLHEGKIKSKLAE